MKGKASSTSKSIDVKTAPSDSITGYTTAVNQVPFTIIVSVNSANMPYNFIFIYLINC